MRDMPESVRVRELRSSIALEIDAGGGVAEFWPIYRAPIVGKFDSTSR